MNNKNWKLTPIPELMKELEVDSRGFPVPYVVLRDKESKPHFKINDEGKTAWCIASDLCSICGKKLDEDKWMISGPQSAFHPYGVCVDIPIHKECGMYALKVCPYMAFSGYQSKMDLSKIKAEDFGKEKMLFINPTQSSDRVPYFAFFKITGYSIRQSGVNRYVIPKRPYLEIELWKDGERLFEAEEKTELLKLSKL